MDAQQVGWTYWAWKYYGDPTGSADESLVMADGRLRSTAFVLSRTYPQAVAGSRSFSTSPRRPACSTSRTCPTTTSTRPP